MACEGDGPLSPKRSITIFASKTSCFLQRRASAGPFLQDRPQSSRSTPSLRHPARNVVKSQDLARCCDCAQHDEQFADMDRRGKVFHESGARGCNRCGPKERRFRGPPGVLGNYVASYTVVVLAKASKLSLVSNCLGVQGGGRMPQASPPGTPPATETPSTRRSTWQNAGNNRPCPVAFS